MGRLKCWGITVLVALCVMIFACSAAAGGGQVNDTINIDVVVGEDIYYEFYHDNNYVDGVGFIAKRDGGDYPDWGDIIFNSFDSKNPRMAYIKATAKTAGEWSFRAGVFEIPAMSKLEDRLYTVQINLRVRAANSGTLPAQPSNAGYNMGALGQCFVLCESLSVRMEPNVSSSIVGNFSYGQTFPYIEQSGDWCKVNVNGTIGWINAQYVLLDPSYYTSQSETAVFAYPDPHSKRVGLLDANTQVAIIADLTDYYCVSLRGASAFIRK